MCFVIPPIVGAIMAGVSVAGSVAGTVVGANAQAQAGEAGAQAAEFAAAQGRRNAGLAEVAAQDSIRRGGVDAARMRAQGRKLGAAQRVAIADSGVEGSSGSALAVQQESAAFSELDAQTIKANAALEAHGYRAQGSQFNAQAAMDLKNAQYSRDRGAYGAAGAVLGGVGNAASLTAQAFDHFKI